MSNSNRIIALLLIGLAWPSIGLGFMSVHFRYLPTGLELAAQAIGLFLAGIVSGLLFLSVRGVFTSKFSLGLVSIGYFLFAPIGIMLALLAPGPVMTAGSDSPLALILLVPLVIMLYSNTAIAAGLGITGGLAKSAQRLSTII